jgi:hypothetical protein
MNGITRGTRWGFSLWEFEAYGYPIAGKGVTGGAEGTIAGEPGAAQAELNPELPENTELLPNYPNPFNPATTIAYRLAVSSEVLLQVYDLNGRLVATLQQGMRQAGEHRAEFDGSNLASGTYIVRLQADGLQLTRMMTLLK